MIPPPASPARALRELLPRYVAEWVRLASRRPLAATPPHAVPSDAGASSAASVDRDSAAALLPPPTSAAAASPPSPRSARFEIAEDRPNGSEAPSAADRTPPEVRSARFDEPVLRDASVDGGPPVAGAAVGKGKDDSVDGRLREAAGDARPSSEASASTEMCAHRLLYVDAFARSGLHAVERSAGGVLRAVDGERSVAAVRALFAAAAREGDAHHPVHAAAVLVDDDPGHLVALREELTAAGLGDAVRMARDPGVRAKPGEIVLLEADFASVAGALLAPADDDEGTQALFLLAPPAARRLPWPALAPLAAAAGVDVLLALPHADLHRHSAFADTSLADLPPQPRRMVEGYSALLGDPRHAWLAAWRRAEREQGPAAAEAAFIDRLADRLHDAADGRTVRARRLAHAPPPAA
ncbi:MAG: hypothetical protein JWM27_2383, partial [Gemmatimonadetes bacterium]|nr:hypothetical protein [Gemmatimonadota bacterium]